MIKELIFKRLFIKDYEIILEAIRRLRDGVYLLEDEDQLFVADLYQRLRIALHDHLEFELEAFPWQDRELEDLRALISAAHHELIETHPGDFKVEIESLRTNLERHISSDAAIPRRQWALVPPSPTLMRMKERAAAGFL